MNLKQALLQEEWADSFKTSHRYKNSESTVEVFKNPSMKEMDEVAQNIDYDDDDEQKRKEIRYIAYGPTKTLYVFNPNTLHGYIAVHLKLKDYDKVPVVGGVATKINGKWTTTAAHNVDIFVNKATKEADWTWIDKYIITTPYLKKFLKEEWADSFTIKDPVTRRSKTVEIFRNPSRKEMEEASNRGNTLRFIATLNPKKLLIWDANILHGPVAHEFKIDIHGNNPNIVAGIIKRKGSSWVMDSSFSYLRAESDIKKQIRLKNWRWTDKSFSGLQEYLGSNRKENLKEEWVESFKDGAKTKEIFVNPTTKEVSQFNKKGIRWIADSKTKRFYIADMTVWHAAMLSNLNLLKDPSYGELPHFISDRWLTGTYYYDKFDSDALKPGGGANKEMSKKTLIKDWKWSYKYIPGLDKYVEKLKKSYNIKTLKEEWEDSFEYKRYGKKRTIEIFVNPSQKEMGEVSQTIGSDKYLRFIAKDNNKKVYVFQPSVLHADASKELQFTESEIFAPKGYYWGTAIKTRTGWELEGSDTSKNREFPKYAHKYIRPEETIGRSVDPNEFGMDEEWKDSFKTWGRNPGVTKSKMIDVFVNPTTKEMLEAEEGLALRFIADSNTKKVYVFTPEMLHWEIAQKLGLSDGMEDYFNNTKLLGGIGKLSSGKFRLERLPHNVRNIGAGPKELQTLVTKAKRDWSFVDKYVAGTSTKLKETATSYEKRLKKRFAKEWIKEQYEL